MSEKNKKKLGIWYILYLSIFYFFLVLLCFALAYKLGRELVWIDSK